MDVRAFGSWMSALKCLFSRILTPLTEVLGRDIRANDPRMSAGCPPPKLPLWADFSFLKKKNPVETAPRNCRFLSLVVVERALIGWPRLSGRTSGSFRPSLGVQVLAAFSFQQVLNLTPLNPTPATCHKRKRKLRSSFRSAALQKLHCNIGFSAVR